MDFRLSSQFGYLDPKSTYLRFQATTHAEDNVDTAMKIDNSAHSFISELRLRSRGTELEYLQEYDTLSAILNDIFMDNSRRRKFAY